MVNDILSVYPVSSTGQTWRRSSSVRSEAVESVRRGLRDVERPPVRAGQADRCF
jgi:hypothetical protein